MGTVIRLKPKSTRVFENEQQVRLRPTSFDGSTRPAANILNQAGSGESGSFGTWSRVVKRPKINAIPAVHNATVYESGEQLGNKSFTLREGAIPQVPDYMMVLFEDLDNSILGNGGDGTVTVNYDDDTDTARVDSWQMSVDGLGPHTTTYKVKEVTSVTGTGFDTVGAGAPGALDALYISMYVPSGAGDLAEMLSCPLRWGQGPAGDPNVGSLSNQMCYAESSDTSDSGVYVTAPPWIEGMTRNIISVSIDWYTKLMGTSAAGGIDLVMKFGDSDPWVLGNNSSVDAETSPGELDSITLNTCPATGNPWTQEDYENMKVGVIFRGDSPGVTKRWTALRIQLNAYPGFVHPTIDGEDPNNFDQTHEAVNKDPFDTSPDDSIYVMAYGDQTDYNGFEFEELPSEALSVNYCEGVIRWTMLNCGDKNSTGENDFACAVYNDPKGGNELHYMLGTLEQENAGGHQLYFLGFPSSIIGTRYFANRGDPVDGCGPFQGTVAGQEGDGYGDFIVRKWKRTTNSAGNPIAVSDINNTNFGFGLRGGGNRDHETQISQTYCEVEYLRSPSGGEVYYHFAVDDDIDSPDDSKFMRSQHSSNKKFGTDFAGIPEVTAINSVTVKVRARSVEGVKGKISSGWRIVWRLGDDSGTDVNETIVANNYEFSTYSYAKSVSPFTSLPWTREEVNNLVVIWESIGENDYVEKQISAINLEIDLELIPDKIDAARDIVSRKLRLLRKPQPFLELALPPEFADIRMLDDLLVAHNAIPRTAETLGFEDWDLSLMRLFRKSIDLDSGVVNLTLLDLREFLTTLWITGSTKASGQSTEGMAVLTPGVSLNFSRPTNDYRRDDFAGLFEELKGDEPPTGLNGILVQNSTYNRVLNSAFSEGATNVFTNWNQVIGTGGSIVEAANIFSEDIVGNTPRSVIMTTPTTPADATLLWQNVSVDRGDSPYSPEGSDYAVKVIHKDLDGHPLSLRFEIDPPGYGDYYFTDYGDWYYSGGPYYHTLPVRSEITEDLFHFSLSRMEVIPTSPTTDTLDMRTYLAARTSSGARNQIYGVQIEGGRFADWTAKRYDTNFILTRDDPVIRDGLTFFIPNNRQRPIYPAETRGVIGLEVKPLWDSTKLPRRVGAKRYAYGMIVDGGTYDELYYDCDDQKWVFKRSVAGNVVTSDLFFPEVVRGEWIELAVRWISLDGDLDETPLTVQLFVNGVGGSKAVATQRMTLGTSNPLYLGSRDGTDGEMLDGWIRRLEVKQFALTEAGIRRLFT